MYSDFCLIHTSQILRSSVQKCLEQCSSLRVSSIAFPSIGTGNLRYPDDVVAKCIVDEVITFLSSHQSTSLKVVHLVIYMQKTYQAFQSALSKWTSPSSTEVTNDSPGIKYRPALSTPHTNFSEELSFKIGDFQVELEMGDISSNASDIIVNPTNSTMTLVGHGVAGALLKKGGPELQNLCDTVIANITELKGDKVAETAAPGNLRCKMLFHINFEGHDTKLFFKVLTACLRKAEDKRCTSIAFPAIGTGVHGCNPQQAATVMVQAIHSFASSKPKHLKKIQIVIYVESIFQQFLKIFQNPESAAQPGFVRRAINFVSSFMPGGGSTLIPENDSEASRFTEIEEDDSLSKELEIKIYGETEAAISSAERKIDNLIDEMFITENIENFSEFIATLPESEEKKLRKECKDLKVKLEIDRELLKRITLKGDKAAVHKMRSIATQILSEYANALSKQEAAKQLSQTIQWRRMDSDESYSNYDHTVNYELEQAYQTKRPNYTSGSPGSIYYFTVDLKRYVETDHVTNGEHKVERIDVIKQLKEGMFQYSLLYFLYFMLGHGMYIPWKFC